MFFRKIATLFREMGVTKKRMSIETAREIAVSSNYSKYTNSELSEAFYVLCEDFSETKSELSYEQAATVWPYFFEGRP